MAMKKDKNVKKNKTYTYIYGIVLILTFFWWFTFARPSENLDVYICRDYELASYSMRAYKHNMSALAKFHHKRIQSCIDLMDKYKYNSGFFNRMEKCSITDAATESVIPLVQLLLSNGEDNVAKKELSTLLEAMQPYSYCPQYDDNLRTIVKYKRLLDL